MLRVGTSGYSFPDWVGTAYPADVRPEGMLGYYERQLGFDCVELNFTYYRLPTVRTIAGIVRRTRPGFSLAVKSHKDMTHEITDEEGGLRDVRPTFGQFLDGLAPAMEAGRLACVLSQFPPWFAPCAQSLDYIELSRELLGDVPLVVEFRNRAWVSEETFAFLGERGISYAVVDEPRLPKLMPFEPRATGPVGYFRFHGRNQNWFGASAEERYDYLYSDDELAGFVEPLREVEGLTQVTYAFFNNCHAGSAARNATRMRQLLGQQTQPPGAQLDLI